ncbi:FMN-dependent NADH-azoreductase [Serratia plymuthica]|uniref:FMN-dependent NADH-azoreductase n=1 Tax=Serratia plymuthica TaxID=82996 RepID=UPI0021795773|nr:NAD(P)H-dependent oxidoreductase [Serratia plymuthica]CAI1241017.1 FMN-dependent NADH-azoreductase [Serratia plymuthica]
MNRLLHLDTGIHVPNSVSRQLSAAIVDWFKITNKAIDITYRDLATNPLPALTGTVLASINSTDISTLSPKRQTEVHESNKALDEFMAADIVVIGMTFYNFSLPSALKTWLDRVIVSDKAFANDANGIGRLRGKRVIIAISRADMFSNGSSFTPREHAMRYLRDIFSVIGINDLDVIIGEGRNLGA